MPAQKSEGAIVETQHPPKAPEQVLTFEQRHQNAAAWLKEFGNSDLKIGEPQGIFSRGMGEKIGIYYKDEHVGSLHSEKKDFTEPDFKNGVKAILDNKKIQYDSKVEIIEPKKELTIGEGAKERAKELGIHWFSYTPQDGRKILKLSANLSLEKEGKIIDVVVDAEDDNDPQTSVELSVEKSSGNLILKSEDKNGVTYYEFSKDKDGVVIMTKK
ncbi:MAG: hypothetical protein JWP09_944 [Candidatus Taylorbacteria bacterium]|nr:hypothetical protein [Candidatus Taylorbacteria bacterium]